MIARIGLVVIAVMLIGIGFDAAVARAIDPFKDLCGAANAGGSTVCKDKGNGTNNPLLGPHGVITDVVEVTAIVAGIVTVFILVYAGLTYITAGGEPGKVKQAQDTARNAVIGMVVISVAGSIVSFVLTKL